MYPMDCCADDGEGWHSNGRHGPEVRPCHGAFDARVLQARRLLPPRKTPPPRSCSIGPRWQN
eukprot:1537682-Heterocapsa_arctica.AAC.1